MIGEVVERYGLPLLKGLAVIALLYVSVSFAAYSLRHPEKTHTQTLLNWQDALLWR